MQATYLTLRREDARENLSKIAGELNASFSDFNVRQAELARDRWDKYAEIAELQEGDPLLLEVAAAFEWLDQEFEEEQRQLEYKRALASLDQGLDNEKIEQAELVRLFHTVERFDEPIPDRLTRRYSERIKNFELASRRRSRLILASSVFAILAMGAVAGLITMHQIKQGRIAAATTSLQGFVQENRIDEATDFLESWTPTIPAWLPHPRFLA